MTLSRLAEALDSRAAVEVLAQGQLGCGCRAWVFDSIERRRVAEPGLPPVFELIIGHRLMIHLVRGDGLNQGEVRGLIERGLSLRDQKGLNRFRLVLVGHKNEWPGGDLPSGPDDRSHVHWLSENDLTAALSKNIRYVR